MRKITELENRVDALEKSLKQADEAILVLYQLTEKLKDFAVNDHQRLMQAINNPVRLMTFSGDWLPTIVK